ncbi:hypothetical protein GCM10020331_085860 [Ectobacillus funiculus]
MKAKHFYHAPHLMVIPGLAIMIVVLMSNLLGDFLRDRFDVKKIKKRRRIMAILTIKELTIQHQDNTIVNNVSLTIHKGEWLALVGESGSGKKV